MWVLLASALLTSFTAEGEMSRSHEPQLIKPLRGLWQRGPNPEVSAPEGFLSDMQNFEYYGDNIGTRRDFVSLLSTPSVPQRFFRFARSSGAARYLWIDSSGNLYDTGAAVPSTPILASGTAGWGAPAYFSMVSMFDRAYITPHTLSEGPTGSFVWVYNPDWTGIQIRKAAGTRPNTAGVGGATAAGGNCEPGRHLVAISFETTSGFITKFGSTVLQFTCTTANRKINLTSVPTGTANVVTKRHILMTKVIPSWDGNVLSKEFFFVGVINDNTTTTFTIDKFDSELVRSADFLEDMLEEIPAGTTIMEYKGSMCVAGEQANPAIARVSVKGSPESIAETDGFVNFDSTDGRGVRVLVDDGENLRAFKSARAMYTRDNGGPPNTWETFTTDGDQGCEIYGVGRMFESGNIDAGSFVVGNSKGLYLFDGSLNQIPLSFNIGSLWLTLAVGNSPQVVIDTVKRRIYVLMSPSYLLVGDYTYGLNNEGIRWSVFAFRTSGGGVSSVKAIQAHPGGVIITHTAYNGFSVGVVGEVAGSGQDHWGGKVPQSCRMYGLPRDSQGYTFHFSEWRIYGLLSSGVGNYGVDPLVVKDVKLFGGASAMPADTFTSPSTFGKTTDANGGMLALSVSSDPAQAQSLMFESASLFYKVTAATGTAQ